MRYLDRPAFDGFLRSLVDAGYELIGPTVRDGAIVLDRIDGDATLGRLARWVDDVPGRGACGLPDGAVRLLRSALEVFGADVRAHLRGRRCAGSRWPRILPVPQPGEAA